MKMRDINGRCRWLLLTLLGSALITGFVLTAQSPAEDPSDKIAAGVPDTQKLAGADGDRFAPKLSEAEQQIEAALAKPVTCKFRDTALSDVVADLAKQVELPIELDDEGLAEAGVERTSPISFEAGPLSLRAVLTLLQVRHHLGYMSGLAGLRLTSQEIAAEQENQIVRVYPVADLLGSFPVADYLEEYDSIVNLISDHIEPDSWSDNGGSATVHGFGGCLAVRHSLARQHEVAGLLGAVRKVRREAGQKSPQVVKAMPGQAEEALSKLLSGDHKSDLNDFLAEVSAGIKTPLVVSLEGLQQADAELTSSVTGAYRDQPAGKVLVELLRPLHLTAVVHPEFVLITCEDDDVVQETRIYPLSELPVPKVRERYRASCGMLDPASDELQDLITATVSPDSWTDNGGSGVISSIQNPPAIAITSRREVHAQIERLLASLRESGKEKIALDAKADEKIIERIYTLYLPRRQLKVELARPKADPAATTPAAPAPAATPPAAAPAPAAPAAVPKPAKPANEADPFGSNVRQRSRQPLAQFGGMGMGGMGGMGHGQGGIGLCATPWGTSSGFAQVTDPIPSADDVAALIRELLPDPSWKEEGVLLKPFHDVIIVRQRGPMLRKVERLLGDIDAWHSPMHPTGGLIQTIPVVGDWR